MVTATVDFNKYLGQHNEGNHTALYGDVQSHLNGRDMRVPIVAPGDPNCAPPMQAHQDGCFKGCHKPDFCYTCHPKIKPYAPVNP